MIFESFQIWLPDIFFFFSLKGWLLYIQNLTKKKKYNAFWNCSLESQMLLVLIPFLNFLIIYFACPKIIEIYKIMPLRIALLENLMPLVMYSHVISDYHPFVLQGSICFLLGLFFLFVRWPIVGIILEIYGFIALFRSVFLSQALNWMQQWCWS